MKVEMGELREELEKDHKRTLEQVIDRFSHKKNPYFILVYTEEGLDVIPDDGVGLKPGDKVMRVDDKTVIRTKFIVCDMNKTVNRYLEAVMRGSFRILGMMCYKVDNQLGQLTRLWILPQDVPQTEGRVDEDEVVKEILEGFPIIGKFLS